MPCPPVFGRRSIATSASAAIFPAVSLRKVLKRAGVAVKRVDAADFQFVNLCRLLAWAKDRRLIDDVRADTGSGSASPATDVPAALRPLLRFNLPNSPSPGNSWRWRASAEQICVDRILLVDG